MRRVRGRGGGVKGYCPRQGKNHLQITPFCVAACRWRNVSLAFREMHSPFSSFAIAMTGEVEGEY